MLPLSLLQPLTLLTSLVTFKLFVTFTSPLLFPSPLLLSYLPSLPCFFRHLCFPLTRHLCFSLLYHSHSSYLVIFTLHIRCSLFSYSSFPSFYSSSFSLFIFVISELLFLIIFTLHTRHFRAPIPHHFHSSYSSFPPFSFVIPFSLPCHSRLFPSSFPRRRESRNKNS